MNSLDFTICLCGTSDELFSNQIMISKPYLSIKWTLDIETLEQETISTISQLIEYIKSTNVSKAALGEYGLENLSYQNTYIKYDDYLLGIKNDQVITDVFTYFCTDHLEFVHFQVVGASLDNKEGYRFSVYCREDSHRYLPHVHVVKDDISVRYNIETLEPLDRHVKPHKNDYRKKIKPVLEENRNKLFDMWKHNMAGFNTPEISIDGSQYYSES